MTRLGMWDALCGVVRRDLLLAMRRRSDAAMPVFFLVIVASLFPLGVGPEPAVRRTIGPGVLWVAALLACLLSLGRVFTADYLDGVLEQMVLINMPASCCSAPRSTICAAPIGPAGCLRWSASSTCPLSIFP
ncbi:MAG: hypothetical protein HP493_01045 [Nitrospira sp.]|nr:hypothetical protein [Nitrospira sp.]